MVVVVGVVRFHIDVVSFLVEVGVALLAYFFFQNGGILEVGSGKVSRRFILRNLVGAAGLVRLNDETFDLVRQHSQSFVF